MDDEDDVSTDDDEDVSFPPATDTDSATAPRLSGGHGHRDLFLHS